MEIGDVILKDMVAHKIVEIVRDGNGNIIGVSYEEVSN